jgi:hypothetical protein
MARPRFHLLSTLPLAALLYRRRGPFGAAGAVAGGLFIDLDHLVDYVWTRARGGEPAHYLAPLHAWELAGAVAATAAAAIRLSPRQLLPDSVIGPGVTSRALRAPVGAALAGLAAGMWLHLLHDVLSNRPRHAGVYSLAYRLKHRFRKEATGWSKETGFHSWSALPWYRWWQAL